MRLFCLLFPLFLFAKPLEVEVLARSAILMNAETGVVLFDKKGRTRSFPASTTKIATTLYVLEKGVPLDQMMTVSAECLKPRPLKDRDLLPAHWLDSDGTTMGLKRGEVVSLESLLHGTMLVSGNDAANVIAESVGGTIPGFMKQLNEYLKGIGCAETNFRNPHGLNHPEHYSTAYDLALMAKRGLQIPMFRKIVSTLQHIKPATNKQPVTAIRLQNGLMKPKGKHYYPKAIGIKTGYTSAAQHNLVAAAEHNGRTLVAVVLGCECSDDRYIDAKKLFETAFAEKKENRRLIGVENVFVKEIIGAKLPLKASLRKELGISFFPSEEPQCKAALHWNTESLPIHKGQKVGEIHILDEVSGALLQKEDLVASLDVKGTFFFMLKEKLRKFNPFLKG